MKLQTEVNIENFDFKITPSSKVLIMGSCFAEHIGERLSALEGVVKNPYGVIYNPLSIATCTNALYDGRKFDATDLELRDGLYHSFLHHGSFSKSSIDDTLKAINTPAIKNFDVIVLTLGTAFVYERNGSVVSNCHKFPEREFSRRLASVDECTNALQSIASLYPNAQFILTISPIRHLRDGLAANFLSKATLRLAVDNFIRANSGKVNYFPSYEILIDELRDYRFTTDDMCHPTNQAAAHIYDRFETVAIDGDAAKIIANSDKAKKQASHRPLR